MHFLRHSIMTVFATATIVLSLAGCLGSKVNQANFDKINTGIAGVNGMNIKEVKDVMGEPTEQNSGGIGLGGVGINGRSMTWKDGEKSITIMFINDQAVTKSQVGI